MTGRPTPAKDLLWRIRNGHNPHAEPPARPLVRAHRRGEVYEHNHTYHAHADHPNVSIDAMHLSVELPGVVA